MTPELHLFIIWSNAKNKETEILADMAARFKILGIHTITWDKKHFSANLTRFYGENLPPHSNKEKLCGNDPFTLIVVLDESPLYRPRMTSKGSKTVNVNIFDSKEMYRHWTGGGHMIHGTNSDEEVRHDLILLTGMSKTDYLKKVEKEGTALKDVFHEMPGENGWDSMDQVLYVLNETIEYVVLRNFAGLFSDFNKSVHGDVDILATKRYLAQLALNAKPVYRSKRRVRHIVRIGDGGAYFDIRYVGDNYYCKTWEKQILAKRVWNEDGYYRPDEENYLYTLLYHALVQKKKIADDYSKVFAASFAGQSEEQLKRTLKNYLRDHNYSMKEPYDYTVSFNESVTGEKMSAKKFIYKVWHKLFK